MKLHLSPSTVVEIKRDALVFLGALLSTGVLDGSISTASLVAALVTAVKVTARQLVPHDPGAGV